MLNKLLNQLVNESETLAGEIGAKDAFDKKIELLKAMKELGVEPIQYNVEAVPVQDSNNDKVLEVVKLLVKEMQNMERTILSMHNNIEELKKKQVQVDTISVNMPVELDETLARIEANQKQVWERFDQLEEKIGTPVVQAPQAVVETNEEGELQRTTVFTKKDLHEKLGYEVSDAAFVEFLNIQQQWEDSFKGLCPEPKEWIPGAEGDGYPAPEGFIIPLYVLENPCYKGYYINLLNQENETEDEEALRIAEEDAAKIEETIVDPDTGEEIVEEEETVEEENEVEVAMEEPVEETEEEVEDTWEDYGVTEEEVMNNIPDDVIVKTDEETEEETEEEVEDDQEYFTEDGDDVTDKVRALKQMNPDLSEEDYIELATDWLTYLPDAKDLNKFDFVPNTEKDVITAKIYIEFYANERGDQAVQDEINYWSQNVDEEGLYIEEERFYDFLNESNIEAFTEHLFNVFEE